MVRVLRRVVAESPRPIKGRLERGGSRNGERRDEEEYRQQPYRQQPYRQSTSGAGAVKALMIQPGTGVLMAGVSPAKDDYVIGW